MKRNIDLKLRKERIKLDRLADRAMRKGKPLSRDRKIIKQSGKVDKLVNEKMGERGHSEFFAQRG